MAKIFAIFMLLLCINIMIVVNGVKTDFATSFITKMTGASEENVIAGLDSPSGGISLNNATTSQLNVQGKNWWDGVRQFFDSVMLTVGFITDYVATFLFAPLVMGAVLQFPTWLFWMICVPLSAAFWVSGIMFLRGVN
jgi:hypothetical protein